MLSFYTAFLECLFQRKEYFPVPTVLGPQMESRSLLMRVVSLPTCFVKFLNDVGKILPTWLTKLLQRTFIRDQMLLNLTGKVSSGLTHIASITATQKFVHNSKLKGFWNLIFTRKYTWFYVIWKRYLLLFLYIICLQEDFTFSNRPNIYQ